MFASFESRDDLEDDGSMEPSPSSFTSPLDTFAAMTAAGVFQHQHQHQHPQQHESQEKQYNSFNDMDYAAENDVNDNFAADTTSNLSRNGSSARMNAVAKLKRAASQREMRNKSPGPNLDGPSSSFRTTPEPDLLQHIRPYPSHEGTSGFGSVNAFSGSSLTPSPLPDLLNVSSFNVDRHDGDQSSTGAGGLQRSRSRNEGGGRSPLPSLEQLRARILQERAAAGLARSASTSAASAAARQYALDKLLGSSGREGALSPVSDTAEDQEEEEKRASASHATKRLTLRRSRTIGGMSAAAEAQRKAAFVEALDQGVPDDLRSRRSSRRFAHAPPGTSDLNSNQNGHTDTLTVPGASQERQIARTEMLRKLSTRRGARSPGNALDENLDRAEERNQKVLQNEVEEGVTIVTPSNEKQPTLTPSSSTLQPSVLSHITQSSGPLLSPKGWPGIGAPSPRSPSHLLSVPRSGAGGLVRSPSTHSSAGGLHEDERNRASEMARLFGEEAFEYERLLELGYSTDDAYERVASARSFCSNSFADGNSTLISPRSMQGDWGENGKPTSAPTSPTKAKLLNHTKTQLSEQLPLLQNDVQIDLTTNKQTALANETEVNIPTNVSPMNTTTLGQEEWASKHPSEASIPLGFDASQIDDSNIKSVPISVSNDLSRTIEARAGSIPAYPESIVEASRTSLSSGNRESDSNKHKVNSLSSLHSPEPAKMVRIESLLTPGFLTEIGNPLDYSTSPGPEKENPFDSHREAISEGESSGSSIENGADVIERRKNSDDYLQDVERMTRKLERFARKSKKSPVVDVFQSPTADQSQFDETVSTQQSSSKDGDGQHTNERWQIKNGYDRVAYRGHKSGASISKKRDGLSEVSKVVITPVLGALPVPDPESATPSQYSANEKLAPFPGLLTQKSAEDGSTIPRVHQVKRKPSPLVNPPAGPLPQPPPTSYNKGNIEDLSKTTPSPAASEPSSVTPKETFFSSLRRKASNATSRKGSGSPSPNPVELNEKEARPSSPTKKFASFLTRKVSQKAVNGTSSHKRDESFARSNGDKTQSPQQQNGQTTILMSGNSPATQSGASKVQFEQPSKVQQSKDVVTKDAEQDESKQQEKEASTTASAVNPALVRVVGGANHSRNASISSTMTNSQIDDPSLMLDSGHALSPSLLLPPAAMAPATAAILHRYSHVLTAPNESSDLPEIPGLDMKNLLNPPRRFIMSAPMLQVVTSSTVKDRFMFLFSDLILLAKPIRPPTKEIDSSALPTLEWTFSVKSILPLNEVKLTLPKSERRPNAAQTPLMSQFVSQFSLNQKESLSNVIKQTHLPDDIATRARLLHQTPELDKTKLSEYLFASEHESVQVMRAFVYQEKFSGVSIESALRSLLLELRFPSKREALQEMLTVFARQWTETNRGLIKDTFSSKLAIELVNAIMTLNDALHSHEEEAPGYYCESKPSMSNDDFIRSFREFDPNLVLSDRTLSRIYSSVKADVVQQARLLDESGAQSTVRILAPGVPMRIVYGLWSEPIRIAIPQADPGFIVRIYGQGLQFSPQILSFEKSHVQEFKVTSKSLGVHSIIFVRAGKNANKYTSLSRNLGEDFPLPRSINLSVQRAFMQHCFTVTHAGARRFMMSVEDETKRKAWLRGIKGNLDSAQRQKNEGPSSQTNKSSADVLALHVLKETLIKPDVQITPLQRSASTASPLNNGSLNASKIQFANAAAAASLGRAPSDSRALLHPLHGIGAAAMGLNPINNRNIGTKMLGLGHPNLLMNSNVSRQESISKHYYGANGPGHSERDLLKQNQLFQTPTSSNSISTNDLHGGSGLDRSVSSSSAATTTSKKPIENLTGEELILTVKQNSLLSLVISHAQSNSNKKPL